MELFATDTKDIVVDGKTFSIVVTIHTDLDPEPSFDYGNEEENAMALADLESGKVVCMFIKVTATAFDLEGTDTLHGCFVSKAEDILDTVNDHTMIDNATNELISKLKIIWAAKPEGGAK